jgi:hypothetical protein
VAFVGIQYTANHATPREEFIDILSHE